MTSNDQPVTDEPDDAGSDIVAPHRALDYAAFTAQARKDGIDVDALQNLLWLINAHPQLLGHRQCLQNLQRLLQRADLVEALEDWAGKWHQTAGRWAPITQWAATVKPSPDGALAPFFREPAHERHHVLMHHGLGRGPVAGVLWVRHHADLDPAHTHSALGPESSAYGLLQWHLTCSHAETRARSSTVTQYEHYSGQDEWPAEPIRAEDAARAVRDPALHRPSAGYPGAAAALWHALNLAGVAPLRRPELRDFALATGMRVPALKPHWNKARAG